MQITSVPELCGAETLKSPTKAIVATRDHDYTPSITHPLTRTRHRYVVGDRFHDGPGSASHNKKTCKYHNMRLCPELRDYQSVTSEVINAKIKSIRQLSTKCIALFFLQPFDGLLPQHGYRPTAICSCYEISTTW